MENRANPFTGKKTEKVNRKTVESFAESHGTVQKYRIIIEDKITKKSRDLKTFMTFEEAKRYIRENRNLLNNCTVLGFPTTRTATKGVNVIKFDLD